MVQGHSHYKDCSSWSILDVALLSSILTVARTSASGCVEASTPVSALIDHVGLCLIDCVGSSGFR